MFQHTLRHIYVLPQRSPWILSPFSTDRTEAQRNQIVWLRTAQPGSNSKARAGPRPLDSQAKALITGFQHGEQFLPKERDEDVKCCLSWRAEQPLEIKGSVKRIVTDPLGTLRRQQSKEKWLIDALYFHQLKGFSLLVTGLGYLSASLRAPWARVYVIFMSIPTTNTQEHLA